MNTVLFLCTGNSCRSQLAEAVVNAFLSNQWLAFSAGTKPAGYVHPMAIQVLEEIGVHHQGYSKQVDEFQGREFDLVITVCDSAAEECPLWLGKGLIMHHSFTDPSTSGEIAEFRKVRDAIQNEIILLLRMESGKKGHR